MTGKVTPFRFDDETIKMELNRGNFTHVNDTDKHKIVSDTFCNKILTMVEARDAEIAKLQSQLKVMRDALEEIVKPENLGNRLNIARETLKEVEVDNEIIKSASNCGISYYPEDVPFPCHRIKTLCPCAKWKLRVKDE